MGRLTFYKQPWRFHDCYDYTRLSAGWRAKGRKLFIT
jgi:hypothetical protein